MQLDQTGLHPLCSAVGMVSPFVLDRQHEPERDGAGAGAGRAGERPNGELLIQILDSGGVHSVAQKQAPLQKESDQDIPALVVSGCLKTTRKGTVLA